MAEGIREWMGGYGYLKGRVSRVSFYSYCLCTLILMLSPGLIYKTLTAGITPRPVAFVSSVSEDGVENLGTFRCVCQSTSR